MTVIGFTLLVMAIRCAIIHIHIITAEDSYATTDHFLEAKILLRGVLAVISGGNPQLNLCPEF